MGLEHALDFRLGHIVLLIFCFVFHLQIHHPTEHKFQLLRIIDSFLTLDIVRFIYARIYISNHRFNKRSIILVWLPLRANIVLHYKHFSKIITSLALFFVVVCLLNPVFTLLGPKLLVVLRILIKDGFYIAILVFQGYELGVVVINLLRKVVKLICDVNLVLLRLVINEICCFLLCNYKKVHFILQLSHFRIQFTLQSFL